MPYVNEGIDQRAEVLQAAASDSLVYWPKKDGTAQAVDVGTAYVTIFSPFGTEVVARVAASIGADGQLVRAQAWPAATYLLDENYSALWDWESGGVAYSDRQYFDVVKVKLPCLISEAELLELYPDLNTQLASLELAEPSRFIRRAWSELLDRIRAGGNRPSLILDRARLVNPAVHLALHHASNALSREVGDRWDKAADKHWKRYESLFGGLGDMAYDDDEDAVVTPGEKTRVNRLRFGV